MIARWMHQAGRVDHLWVETRNGLAATVCGRNSGVASDLEAATPCGDGHVKCHRCHFCAMAMIGNPEIEVQYDG